MVTVTATVTRDRDQFWENVRDCDRDRDQIARDRDRDQIARDRDRDQIARDRDVTVTENRGHADH